MGIYIEKMELPKGRNETIIRILPNGEILDQYGHHLGVSALSVPPHGRLGDLDKLEKDGWHLQRFQSRQDGCWIEAMEIKDIPTIISPEK